MNIKQINSVLKIVELGSVNRAAIAMHLAPSSVSAQIKELNHELGVEIFVPSGRKIILSPEGLQLIPRFREFVQLAAEIKAQARFVANVPAGELKLFAPSSICIYRLPKIIESLQQSAPQVEIVLTHEPFDYENALKQGEIDAAIVISETKPQPWQALKMYKEDVIYAGHPSRVTRKPLTPEQLSQQALITTEPQCTYRTKAEMHFKSYGLSLKPRQSFANVEVVRRCILSNMGLGLLSHCVVADDLEAGRLVEQKIKGGRYKFNSYLIYPPERSISPKLQSLIEVIKG